MLRYDRGVFIVKVTVESESSYSLQTARAFPVGTMMSQAAWRLFELFFSVVLLVMTLPITLVVAVAIKLESPGPVLYRQERLGKNWQRFTIYKFRSMRVDAEAHGPQWAQKGDTRITRVGKFIRKTRIDELPQLLNVLSGEMSLIGPRPERECFTRAFMKNNVRFSERLAVKPGLTGWAQVNGGYDVTPEEKFELDMYYIRHRSLALDLKILLKTVKVVLTGEGAR